MYTNLSYSNIKGTSNTIRLENVVVITGPNESGKSAAAMALQLAATGRCELGHQAAAQAKIVNGPAASIVAYGKGIESTWSMRSGKKSWEGQDTQGGLPSTLDEFWDLTGIERLRLIAPDGALTSIEKTISEIEASRKSLKSIIDAAAPLQPDPYEGEPIDVLENKIRDIEQKLFASSQAQKANSNKKAIVDMLAASKATIDACMSQIPEFESHLATLNEEYEKASSELAIYQEQASKEPRIVKSARERGVSLQAAIADTLGLVAESLRWVGVEPSEAIGRLVDIVPDCRLQPMAKPVYSGSIESIAGMSLDAAVPSIRAALMHQDRKLSELNIKLEAARNSLSVEVPDGCDSVLSVDEVIDLQAEIGRLKQLISKAGSWSAYEASLARQMEARTKAFVDFEKAGLELNAAKERLTNEVQKLKGAIEVKANEFLEVAGQPRLFIDVSQTGRGWSLDISTGDVAIEALARSKSIMYGACLLAAIHETSAATSPVLMIECAELDPRNFEKLIEAMKLKKKGNVILEHWSKPRVDACIVDLSSGVLV